MPCQGGTVLLALAALLAQPPSGHAYGKPPQCVDIPPDLPLCHDVGYNRMRLPNLLEHDSLAEVKQQAGTWVPLLTKRCHSDTQLFLCSLFAPVCLDQPVYPCHSLCQVVRASCAPLMEAFGFPWPNMLRCARFPPDHQLCIAMQFRSSQATPPPGNRGGQATLSQVTGRTDYPLADLRRGLLLGAVYRWERSNREMRFALKFTFSYPCPPRYALLPGAEQPSGPPPAGHPHNPSTRHLWDSLRSSPHLPGTLLTLPH
uniref:Secreted frizzled related protein 5 n=1 Tax=Chelonoidis abingdonii TaxID=106734 RepID=A0A8C0G206_CHEAB